jgi:DNA-binding PadR family transcriptional regulator
MHHHHHCGHHHGHHHPEGRFAAGRRGFGGGPPFGRGPGGGQGFRGGPFPRTGRMIGDGELRLVVLALLAEQPRHGYDVIKALEERSQGAYSPSPGVVYPTLTYLEEAGYVTATAEGNKKVYAITDEGRAYLDAHRETADGIIAAITAIGEKMAKARAWFYREGDGGGDIPGVVQAMNEARRALKMAIAEKLDARPETQEAVAAILADAAAAIRDLGGEGERSP